jgi:uncharacterized protein YegL
MGRAVMRDGTRQVWLLTLVALTLTVAVRTGAADCARLVRQPAVNHIAIVIDRSGSMGGQALQDAKAGAHAFVDGMKQDDMASIIVFGSSVEVAQAMTNSRTALHAAVNAIRVEGATVLYDAVARAALMLANQEGGRIVVYLTDGRDTGSRYSPSDIHRMNLSEGVFVYGIGLGSVDTQALGKLSDATGGSFEQTRDSSTLRDIYLRVLGQYYARYGNTLSESGSLVVRSFPGGMEVLLDGRKVGFTPYKADAIDPRSVKVGVVFGRGIWECDAEMRRGYRTVADARESDLGADLLILSSPQGAAVFLDDTYVGVTGIASTISPNQEEWAQKAREDTRLLRVRTVPYGNHQLRLRGIPEFEFGPEQELEVTLPVKGEEMILFVDIFRQRVVDQDGTVIAGGRPHDPFEELERETGEPGR